MTDTEAHLTLFSHCLLSKWGFNDGDAPDTWMNWCDSHGIDWRRLGFPLAALVRQHLVPAIEQDITVVDIETVHNPIRVATIDGEDVSHAWTGLVGVPMLTPERVDVPMTEVLRLALADKGFAEPPRNIPSLRHTTTDQTP